VVPLPERLRIGLHCYGVTYDESRVRAFEREEKRPNCYGVSAHRDLQIYLDPTVVRSQQRDTLWHEVKHTVYALVGGFPADTDEEEIILLTASIELMVLRDNPALVAFLLEPDLDASG